MGRFKVRRRFIFALAAVVALWLWCPLKLAVVLGGSMEPTLQSGRVILVDRGYYRQHAVQRGDVIAFRYDGVVQVKRVHALPGDRVWEVRYGDTGTVFLADPDALEQTRRLIAPQADTALVSTRVPPDTLYVLGDGGNASYDSRYYGPVPRACVLGRVRLREHGGVYARECADRATLAVLSRRPAARPAAY